MIHFVNIGRLYLGTAEGIAGFAAGMRALGAADIGGDIGDLIRERRSGPQGRQSFAAGKLVLEAFFQEVGGIVGARRQAVGSENDRDQRAAIAGCRCDLVETGRADEAGLHAVGAFEAADEHIDVRHLLYAVGEAFQREIAGILRKFAAQRDAEDRKVTRRRILPLAGQAVRIDEMRVAHAEAGGFRIHPRDEALRRAADRLGDGHGKIVCRLDQHHLQGIVERQLLPGLEIHLRRRLRRGKLRHDDRRIELDLAGLEGTEGDVGRHQLGERRGIPAAKSLLLVEDAPGADIDENMRIGSGRLGGRQKKHGCCCGHRDKPQGGIQAILLRRHDLSFRGPEFSRKLRLFNLYG
ncbi:hypothetical protein RHSP_60679 [Rhizobium freirei PRF 81]|uniref:Uncharacterized protein n=1 Tax=Rhizobium freirei PRF 81 TaxID=363754 RepID=N6UH35_9HYPH|nr:hypothetical protein RHSP_60679 [Rhizobium freirei PRF 81]